MIILQIIDYKNSKLVIKFGPNKRARVGNNIEDEELDDDLENGSHKDPFEDS
jgi:hypothetical protein